MYWKSIYDFNKNLNSSTYVTDENAKQLTVDCFINYCRVKILIQI